MEQKRVAKFRERLLEEDRELIRSINRNRVTQEDIMLEKPQDEVDRATTAHNKEILYNRLERDFQKRQAILQAFIRMDAGKYGECLGCGEDIPEKRLNAVPWTELCCACKEKTEGEPVLRSVMTAGTPGAEIGNPEEEDND